MKNKISKKENKRRMVFALQEAAKAWCEKETSHISMIPELAEAFAKILVVHMYKPHLGCATTREIIEELTARDRGFRLHNPIGRKKEKAMKNNKPSIPVYELKSYLKKNMEVTLIISVAKITHENGNIYFYCDENDCEYNTPSYHRYISDFISLELCEGQDVPEFEIEGNLIIPESFNRVHIEGKLILFCREEEVVWKAKLKDFKGMTLIEPKELPTFADVKGILKDELEVEVPAEGEKDIYGNGLEHWQNKFLEVRDKLKTSKKYGNMRDEDLQQAINQLRSTESELKTAQELNIKLNRQVSVLEEEIEERENRRQIKNKMYRESQSKLDNAQDKIKELEDEYEKVNCVAEKALNKIYKAREVIG